MPKRQDRIDAKIEHIKEQISYLKRNDTILTKIGSTKLPSQEAEIKFQQDRIDILESLSRSSEEEIRDRRTKLEEEAGSDIVSAKYTDVRGLPDYIIMQICEMELIDIALGEHPRLLRERQEKAL